MCLRGEEREGGRRTLIALNTASASTRPHAHRDPGGGETRCFWGVWPPCWVRAACPGLIVVAAAGWQEDL